MAGFTEEGHVFYAEPGTPLGELAVWARSAWAAFLATTDVD